LRMRRRRIFDPFITHQEAHTLFIIAMENSVFKA